MADHVATASYGDLLRMSQDELDALYRRIEAPGSIPIGDTRGTAMLFPGHPRLAAVSRTLARLLLWQGKVFDARRHTLKNKITPLRIRAIAAKVYVGDSWLDRGKETIVLDYSKGSIIARCIRDEIREVTPGLWLGKVYLWRWHVLDFILRA